MAEPLYSLGRWDEAIEVIDRALDLAVPAETRASLWQFAGFIALARGDLETASRAVQPAGRPYAGFRYQAQRLLPQATLRIDLLTAQRRYQEALDTARDTLNQYDLQISPRYAWPMMVAAVRAAAEVAVTPAAARDGGSADAAGELLGAVSTEAAKLRAEGPVQRAQQLTCAAELLRAGHEAADAPAGPADQVAAWEQAVAAWEQVREPYPLAITLFRAAEAALASGGDRDVAAGQLGRAAEIAAGLGARPLAEAVALLARRARISTEGAVAVQHTGAAALTPREFDVLRLIAAGMSNARIASELFISPKTASVHVSNILAKLGASNRSEAAATAHELRLLDAG